ncbi:MAG: carbohydrate porin [Akkermansiaceae bacterium]|nr:carbohydrate porin [Akkermansiaceae bacterium]
MKYFTRTPKTWTALLALSLSGLTAQEENQPSPYLDTRQGWDPAFLSEENVSPSLRKSLPAEKQQTGRVKGVPTPAAIRAQDRRSTRAPGGCPVFFPSSAPKMMPYLDGTYIFGNTCIEPGALIDEDLLSTAAQKVKTAASDIGLQYSLKHGYNYTGVSGDVLPGSQRSFNAYNVSLLANWFLVNSHDGSSGLFLAAEFDWGAGMDYNQRRAGAADSLGSLQNPQGSARSGGPFLANLSLGLSLFEGKWVIMAGQIDTSNYIDQNAYSNSGFNNLVNQCFNNNPALPLPWANWGYQTSWQPCGSFYLMYAGSGNNTPLNHNPFHYINAKAWTHLAEAGFIADDVAGMGPGTLRLQYCLTSSGSNTGSGGALNFQQQLGKQSRVGWFGRLGFMDEDAAAFNGVKSAATTGLVFQSPFRRRGAGNNDQIALGVLWLKPAGSEKPCAHKNEYGVELTYVMQITPTMTLQPDIQLVKNPIHGQGKSTAVVFQIQNVWSW